MQPFSLTGAWSSAAEGRIMPRQKLQSVQAFLDKNRVHLLDVIRIYLGVALFAKGVAFVLDSEALLETMNRANVPASSVLLAHYIALVHLAGGVLLAVGLVTRAAAAVQIPVVLGAILFVHGREGLFTSGQSLELATLVLFLLAVITFAGGGHYSVDHYLRTSAAAQELEHAT